MRDTWIIVAIALFANVIYGRFRKDTAKRAKFAAKFAMVMMLGFSVLAILFISGYAMEDPGGTEGALMVAGLVVPTIGLSLLAWKKPEWMKPVLYVFVLLAIIANLLTIVFPEQYFTFFNTEGPWLGTGSFVFTVVAAVYGYHADRFVAGVLLVIVSLLPFIATLATRDPMAALAGGSSAALLTPGFTAGLLLLLSNRISNTK